MKTPYTVPEVVLPENPKRPMVACAPEELARLRAAYKATGAGHAYLVRHFERVDEDMAEPVVYPPRGKAHGQWYQCDDCQIGLKTLDDTHHQCTKCGKVYTGPPYDDVIYGRIIGRHLRTALYAGWAYQITGDRKYADYTAKILLGYAERYLKYPYHDNRNRVGNRASRSGGRLIEQTLGEASTMVNAIAPMYDLIHDAGVLSAEQHAAVRDKLILPMLKGIDRNKRGKSNWQSWHNAAMLCGGAVIEDADWVNKAIHQEKHGFLYQMDVSVSGDGFWYENSWGYHFYTLSAQVGLCEGARRLGVDLWRHPSMVKMCTLPAYYTMPDGKLPGFNDTHARRPSGRGLEAAYAVFKDPVILSLLDDDLSLETMMYGRDVSLTTAPVQLESQLFAQTGHAILRTAGPGGLAAILDFAPHGGGHGHYDALEVQLYGYAQALGVDRGIAKSQAYRLPIHRDWYKTTVSHNTVLVDEKARDEGTCRLAFFAANDRYAAVGARDEGAYDGVLHRRALVLTPGYLLVFDHVEADRSRRFDWMYHNYGLQVVAETVDMAPAEASFRGGEYLDGVQAGTTDKTVRARFAGETVTTHLTMASFPATRILTATGPGETVLVRVPMAMITREGAAAQFAAALEPVENGKAPEVTEVSCRTDDGNVTVTVTLGDREDVFTLTPGGEFAFRADGEPALSGSQRR